jgi:hypothetical protein
MLRMSGAIPPPHTFMACAQGQPYLTFTVNKQIVYQVLFSYIPGHYNTVIKIPNEELLHSQIHNWFSFINTNAQNFSSLLHVFTTTLHHWLSTFSGSCLTSVWHDSIFLKVMNYKNTKVGGLKFILCCTWQLLQSVINIMHLFAKQVSM